LKGTLNPIGDDMIKHDLGFVGLLAGLFFSGMSFGLFFTYWTLAGKYDALAAENIKLTLYQNRRLRSKSNFRLPGFTSEIQARCEKVAKDFGCKKELLFAQAKHENGGQGLDMGIIEIPEFVSFNYKADDLQFGAAAELANRRLWQFVWRDRELKNLFLTWYAKRYNPLNSTKWDVNITELVNDFEHPVTPAKPVKGGSK